MDGNEAGQYWEKNAAAWTELSRAGYDVYRDLLNTPAFFAILPEVNGLRGLDVGCGEGTQTRLAAERGARMTGLDVAPTFVREAARAGGGVAYVNGSAEALPFADGVFDFAIATMSLMDVPRPEVALREIGRVVRAGGFLQFSISHPCFSTPHRKLLRDAQGEAYAVEVGKYFERQDGRLERWIFGAAPAETRARLRPFEVPLFHRTLSEWLMALLAAGFALEHVAEPCVDVETALRAPQVADTRVVSYFLHVRGRKPV